MKGTSPKPITTQLLSGSLRGATGTLGPAADAPGSVARWPRLWFRLTSSCWRPRPPPASGPAPGAAAAGRWPRRRRSSWCCGCRPAGRRQAQGHCRHPAEARRELLAKREPATCIARPARSPDCLRSRGNGVALDYYKSQCRRRPFNLRKPWPQVLSSQVLA